MFVDVFVSLDLSQWAYTATFFRSGNILDLVFTSSDDRVSEVVVLLPFPGMDIVLLFFMCFQVSRGNHMMC